MRWPGVVAVRCGLSAFIGLALQGDTLPCAPPMGPIWRIPLLGLHCSRSTGSLSLARTHGGGAWFCFAHAVFVLRAVANPDAAHALVIRCAVFVVRRGICGACAGLAGRICRPSSPLCSEGMVAGADGSRLRCDVLPRGARASAARRVPVRWHDDVAILSAGASVEVQRSGWHDAVCATISCLP